MQPLILRKPMKFNRALFLLSTLLLNLHCAPSSSNLVRTPNSFHSRSDCRSELGKLAEKKGSLGAILPPAEVKTLEPLHPENYDSFAKGKKITFATYNVLNLKESVGDYEPNPKTGKRTKNKSGGNKPQHSIDGIAESIKEISPDVLFMQEVEGEDSLINFSERELQNQWRPLTLHGNDGRGIQIGVLVKADLPLKMTYESHRDEPFSSENHPDMDKVFSRDFPVLIAKSPKGGDPLFILGGVHGKSKRTDSEADPESQEIRTAQAKRMVQIIQYYQAKHPKTPFMILGDFNAEVQSEPEYEPLREFDLKDALDLTPNAFPPGSTERVTHTFHPREGSRKASQLDSILLAPPHQDLVLKAGVYRYKSESGSVKPIPQTYEERKQNPSDHYPLWAEIDLQKLVHPK
jgi:endonuclease/exonuclease/phosphatase family metal-dependent hydrolase